MVLNLCPTGCFQGLVSKAPIPVDMELEKKKKKKACAQAIKCDTQETSPEEPHWERDMQGTLARSLETQNMPRRYHQGLNRLWAILVSPTTLGFHNLLKQQKTKSTIGFKDKRYYKSIIVD